MALPARWLFAPGNEESSAALSKALGIAMPAARVLVSRGFGDPAAAEKFLRPSVGELLDPFLLKGMRVAIARLVKAILDREPILLYGDYDVDGTTSIVILKRAIELSGGSAEFHVPHRLKDGYGMKLEVIEQAAARGIRLIVSVDTGIRAAEVVHRAAELGLDVIVTDHHLPETELPPAWAILNPNQPGCDYPNKDLCGAGVALKLAQALFQEMEWPAAKAARMTESFLKMVAIATVADVVSLTGENRVIVKHGLAGLRELKNPGLRALFEVAGMTPDVAPSARSVAFRIAPRINAAGRMDTARDVIDMFLTDDPARAHSLAEQLNALNAERQETEAEIVRAILEECERVPVGGEQFALVFSAPGWHRGVLGIVASRLVERFHRPAFVLGEDVEKGEASGSGRSAAGFHLLDALESMPDLFRKFGGHKYAAGLTLDSARVPEFRRRFLEFAASRLTPDDLRPVFEIDAPIYLNELTDAAVGDLFGLAPFGMGNREPVLAVIGAEVAGPPTVMKEKHLRAQLRQNGRMVTVKAWNFAERAAELEQGRRVDVVIQVEEDAYSASRGYSPWSAVLKDVRAAE